SVRGMRRITPVLLLLVLSVGAAQAAPIVVGTYAYPGRDRAAAVRPLADFVAATLRRPVELRIWPSPSALADGLRAGEADVVVPNLHAYLQARAGAVTLPVPDVPPSQAARYRSVIVGRGINGIAALTPQRAASLRLALVGPDSASGGFVPLARLREAGLEEASFAAVVHAGSHEAARLALQQGQVDVAALAAEVYDAAPLDGASILWRSDPIPPGPLLCRVDPRLSCDEIARALLDAHRQAPAVIEALRAGWPEFGDASRFVEAGDVATGFGLQTVPSTARGAAAPHE